VFVVAAWIYPLCVFGFGLGRRWPTVYPLYASVGVTINLVIDLFVLRLCSSVPSWSLLLMLLLVLFVVAIHFTFVVAAAVGEGQVLPVTLLLLPPLISLIACFLTLLLKVNF
jgi:hypothetical protein